MNLGYYSTANINNGRTRSTSTLRAKSLLKRLEKEDGTKESKEKQKNVERDGEHKRDRDKVCGEEEKAGKL
jgi:hypothetical protein